MGEIQPPLPAMRFAAVSAADPSAIDWAEGELVRHWGACCHRGKPFPFDQTRYYRREMGDALLKQYFAFGSLVDPATLSADKHFSNQLEKRYAESFPSSVKRPVNIDPGYITEAKLVLSTTKNRDHRIYIADGIYAEITLYYQQDRWQASRWTYPDYNSEKCFEFLTASRDILRKQLHSRKRDGTR